MENCSHAAYSESGNSSPPSREFDCENPNSWDDNINYKVKLMCSYGGKIQPRPHDNQLSYIGGETKILTFDRSVRLSGIMAKIYPLGGSDVCFKYQLPGEDLDALITVTNDEDLEHMMIEYDRLLRNVSAKPARLRLFLFPLNPSISSSSDAKSDRQWFVNGLNSPPIRSNYPSPSVSNPDFLFGLDKKGTESVATSKQQDLSAAPPIEAPEESTSSKEIEIGTETIVELEDKLQISNQEQILLQRKNEETLSRPFPGDLYVHNLPGSTAPPPSSVPLPAAYLPVRQIPSGAFVPAPVNDQPVFLYPSPLGFYPPQPGMRLMSGSTGQGYYVPAPAVVPDLHREQPVYGVNIGRTTNPGLTGSVAPSYTHVAYDSTARQVCYPSPSGVLPTYPTQATSHTDMRQPQALAVNPDSNLIPKHSQT